MLKFSIGFGPAIGLGRFRLAWHRGGTDYVIAWFPLGGFVRMLGDTNEEAVGDRTEEPDWRGDPALESQTLGAKPLWQKLFIIGAGPGDEPAAARRSSCGGTLSVGVDRPVAQRSARSSAARRPRAAGLRPGDRIVAVDGKPVRWWDEVEQAVRERPAGRVSLELERGEGGAAVHERVSLDVASRPGLGIFRESKDVGWLGLQHPRQKAVVGVTTPSRPPRRPGSARATACSRSRARPSRTGRASRVPTQSAGPGEPGGAPDRARRRATRARRSRSRCRPSAPSSRLGAIPAVVLVAAVTPGMPAAEAGIRPGDLIVAVDGAPIGSFSTFQETVLREQGPHARGPGRARRDDADACSVTPRRTTTDVAGAEEELYLIGIQGENAILTGAVALDRETQPADRAAARRRH